jgi:hypothetical protein
MNFASGLCSSYAHDMIILIINNIIQLYIGCLESRIARRDTLVQLVHRVPRKFLFIPFGTKAIRQEVTTKNPHTEITYTEYIVLRRR